MESASSNTSQQGSCQSGDDFETRNRVALPGDVKEVVDRLVQTGLNWKHDKEKIQELAQTYKVDIETIKRRINTAKRSLMMPTSTNQQAKRLRKTPYKRGVRGVDIYRRECLGTKKSMADVNKGWQEANGQLKNKFAKKAQQENEERNERMVSKNHLPEEKEAMIKDVLRTIKTKINELNGLVGAEAALIVTYTHDDMPVLITEGTKMGNAFLDKERPGISDLFALYVHGASADASVANSKTLTTKTKRESLIGQVRNIFNTCYRDLTGSRSFPYSKKEEFIFKGLPVPFREPNSYGMRALEDIVKNKGSISLEHASASGPGIESASMSPASEGNVMNMLNEINMNLLTPVHKDVEEGNASSTEDNVPDDNIELDNKSDDRQDDSLLEGDLSQFASISEGDLIGVYVEHHWKGSPQIGKVLNISLEAETVLIHWYSASWSGKCSPLFVGVGTNRKPKSEVLDIRCILLFQFNLTHKKEALTSATIDKLKAAYRGMDLEV